MWRELDAMLYGPRSASLFFPFYTQMALWTISQ